MKLRLLVILLLLVACESKEKRLAQFLLKGNLALRDANTDQALYYYEQATKLDPCYVDAWNNLGTVNYRAGRFSEALASYEKAVACDSSFLPAVINRANTYYELNELYLALADVQKIKRAKPDTSIAYFTEGLVKTKMRDYAGAMTAFDQALLWDSLNAEVWVNRATVAFYQKNFAKAKADLQKAERLNPSEANIYNALALIEGEKGNYTEAIRLVDKALRLKPDAYFVNNRGYFYLQTGELDKAERDINESIMADPSNGWAYRNKGIFYLTKKQYADAERLLKQAYERDTFIDRIDYYLGVTYFHLGKKTEACASFSKAQQSGTAVENVYLQPCIR